jgi:hypothetical protein
MADGVELVPTQVEGVAHVRVHNHDLQNELSWDRYVRLKAAADAIKRLVDPNMRILDVGGYDGALALFLPNYQVDLIDPATTGGSLLHAPVEDQSYDLTVSVDVLEHIEATQRELALTELARITRRYLVLSYPCRETTKAQKIVLKATNNALIREHVEFGLPDSAWVLRTLGEHGFEGTVQPYGCMTMWIGQYLALHLAPPAVAKDLNRFLIDNHAGENSSKPLYHLLVFKKWS